MSGIIILTNCILTTTFIVAAGRFAAHMFYLAALTSHDTIDILYYEQTSPKTKNDLTIAVSFTK